MDGAAEPLDPAEARKKASNANLFALLATALSLLGLCSSCMTLYLALPTAILAIYNARQVMDSDDEVARSQGNTAMALGIMNAFYAGAWILVMLLYILFYVLIFGFAIAGAVVSAPTPVPVGP
jgi:hypothetical protein